MNIPIFCGYHHRFVGVFFCVQNCEHPSVCVGVIIVSLAFFFCAAGGEGSGEPCDPKDAVSGLRHPVRGGYDGLEARHHAQRRHSGASLFAPCGFLGRHNEQRKISRDERLASFSVLCYELPCLSYL